MGILIPLNSTDLTFIDKSLTYPWVEIPYGVVDASPNISSAPFVLTYTSVPYTPLATIVNLTNLVPTSVVRDLIKYDKSYVFAF